MVKVMASETKTLCDERDITEAQQQKLSRIYIFDEFYFCSCGGVKVEYWFIYKLILIKINFVNSF